MYSNKGTTFHGAELFNAHAKAIRDSNFRNRQTEPRGISYPLRCRTSAVWEASVKSVKHHLKRSVSTLTFEEMSMCSSVRGMP